MPVFNGGETLPVCLAAIGRSTMRPSELIVVDDCSTDESATAAAVAGATVIRLEHQSGPATARNIGAQRASGEVVCFIDADCEVQPETLERIARRFSDHPDVAAIFGSYDDKPASSGFFAQYKNLAHRYVHQTSSEVATTFWAGCGAVRREVFLGVGGFDGAKYPRPSIEDIELGYRLSQAGHQILLAKEIVVTHHKAWSFRGMVRSDIYDRAIPWTMLLMSRGKEEKTLNLQWQHRFSAGLVLLLIIALLTSLFEPLALLPALAAAAILVWINRSFYVYLARLRGGLFTLKAIPVHWFTLSYSAVVYAIVSINYRLNRPRSAPAPRG